MPHVHVLERIQTIPRPVREVFPFFSDAGNLERLTPGFLRFRILTPLPVVLAAGTRIEYAIRIFGVRRRWLTLIEEWEPERHFVDVQLRGPYALWRHRHEFEALPARTVMRDRVEYALPFGPLGALAHGVFVRQTVRRIFDYRGRAIESLFGAEPAVDPLSRA